MRRWLLDGVCREWRCTIEERGQPPGVILQDLDLYLDMRQVALDVEIDLNDTFTLGAVGQMSLHTDVSQMDLGAPHEQEYITGDPGQPPHILVFEERRIAPAKHHQCETIFRPCRQVRRQIELCREF